MKAIVKALKRLCPVGTRSLLFGVHNFIWHPWTVYRAWGHLYGPPTWREVICIIIHDWGYWGSANMDGPEGERHPELGARLAYWLFGPAYGDLVLLHSGTYAKLKGRPPSKLYWPDKFCHFHDPAWFYLLRARLTGELTEYRARADRAGFCPGAYTDHYWLKRLRRHLVKEYGRDTPVAVKQRVRA